MMTFIRSVITALTGRAAPSQLAAAVAMGMLLALLPKGNLIAQSLIVLIFLLKVNVPLAAVSTAVFMLLTPLTDRLADPIGYGLLTAGGLRPLWTWLYNRPALPWTAFNNTLVLGNLTLGLILYIPTYLAAKRGVAWYQARLRETIMRWKIVQVIKASAFIRWLYPS